MDFQITRRNAIVAGCVLGGLGGCASLPASDERSQSPGAAGFTAGTVPAESDPLLVIHPEETHHNPATTALAKRLLGGSSFAGIATAIADFSDGPSSDVVSADVGKLAVIGSNTGYGSGAVVWAEWSEDDLREILERPGRDEPEPGTYHGRAIYETDELGAATLADQAVAIGTARVVRSVVDVWHGDTDPVADAVLRPFERTDRDAPVRFATTGLAFQADSPSPRTAEYDPVANTSVSIATEDREAIVDVAYEVEASDAADPLAKALERDLGIGSASAAVEPVLPRGIRGDLAVDRNATVVTVRYRGSVDAVAEHVGDVVTTFGTATGQQ
ncbi:hypothetical protein [Natronorubrum halophilum]|uniref:hypothetical protein n=1 Tax=Natronorubrum halophilum TaxID=1702106 RepID=UPI000EF65614|nr:hypothetical protein [Natronorubrum halophilum]